MNEPRKSPPRQPPSEDQLDAELDGTFPASDPPSFTTPIFAGGPKRAGRPEDRSGADKGRTKPSA